MYIGLSDFDVGLLDSVRVFGVLDWYNGEHRSQRFETRRYRIGNVIRKDLELPFTCVPSAESTEDPV